MRRYEPIEVNIIKPDPSNIEALAARKREENWDFRAYLKWQDDSVSLANGVSASGR